MNSPQLLRYFDRTSNAPDAIPRLRRFILDLAVRGKLVEQDPKDEPASQLLKRIRAEKVRLIQEGKIRKREETSPAIKTDEPFSIPTHWVWTRLGQIGDWGSGSTPPRGNHEYYGEGITWLKSGELNDNQKLAGSQETVTELAVSTGSFRRNQPGDVLIAMYGATIGKVAILAEPAVTNQAVCGCTPFTGVFNRYLFLFLLSQRMELQSSSEGGAQPNISRVKIVGFPFPLAPLAEQKRIVAKVDELMALCDQFEETRNEREGRRDRLVTACLHQLSNSASAGALRANTNFYLRHLPRFTMRVKHIQQLRQTILDLAVRGLLVRQDTCEEPATEVLKHIQEGKRSSVNGRRNKDPRLPSIDPRDAPFSLPVGWAWARFPEVGTFGRGKSKHRPRNDPSLFDGGTHLLIQTGDVARSRGLIKTYTNMYNEFGLAQSLKWPKGTLCITIAANIADSGILTFDACFPDSVVGFIPASVFPNARYFEYFIRTAKADLLEFAPATAQKNINLEILNAVLIPLPPLAEQGRIVNKVDELMAVCDRLEEQLTAAQSGSSRLLEAVLRQVLDDDGGRANLEDGSASLAVVSPVVVADFRDHAVRGGGR